MPFLLNLFNTSTQLFYINILAQFLRIYNLDKKFSEGDWAKGHIYNHFLIVLPNRFS
jgi:hypothetical protein